MKIFSGDGQLDAQRAAAEATGWQPLIRRDTVAELQAFCARQAELARERREAEVRREAEARDAFLAAGGTCWTCRDSGRMVGSLHQPCPDCPRGQQMAYEQRQQRLRDLLAEAHLPPRYASYTLASFPASHIGAYAAVCEFCDGWDGEQGLLLQGAYGTGKTGLLVGVVKLLQARWLDSGHVLRAHFTTGADLLDALREGYSDGSYGAQLQRLKRWPLLVVDDLGAEKPSEWMMERLFVVFNDRYNACLPTFVSTNYGMNQLAERIGPRITERFLQTFCGVEVVGPNLRRRAIADGH